MRFIMAATKRLQQLQLVLQSNNPAHRAYVMRPYTADMNGSTSGGEILQETFSDINSNLLTSEAHCTNFIRHYISLPTEGKIPFLQALASRYGMDRTNLLSAARSVSSVKSLDDTSLLPCAERLRSALRPKYKTLFTHIGRVNGGVKFLVDLRADILNFRQGSMTEMDSALFLELNNMLRELLLMWFTVGFLNLERITWNSPCDLVQKVSNYEAVHRIKTWADIKQRVGPYRRCYIFTHNAMPREPVVVLHTALTNEISSNIRSIIHNARYRPSLYGDEDGIDPSATSGTTTTPLSTVASPSSDLNTPPTPSSPVQTNTLSSSFSSQLTSAVEEEKEDPNQIQSAVFYSITSTQKGLQGIEMGNYLIKSVVKKLQEEFPHLQQFSSLSPIPGFREWLIGQLKHSINKRDIGEDPGVPWLLPNELSALEAFKKTGQNTALDTFKDLLVSHEWVRSVDLTRAVVGPLMRLCAHYLYVQKRRNYALNPVAHFHLSNGAMLWRINFLADTSHRGLMQSCTLMVNYRYFLDSTDANTRSYLERHHITVSPSVLSLLQGSMK